MVSRVQKQDKCHVPKQMLTCPIQDSLRYRRGHVPASLNVKNTKKFFPAIALEQKRISEATAFYDTEYEADESDEESLRKSLDSVSLIAPSYSRHNPNMK